ncbi:MAG: hypothetical protein AAFX06_22455 [Planctomycetota bacterium]
MASIVKERSKSGPNKGKLNGCKTILVVCADQRRRSIRLGKCDIRTAERIKTQIEYLNAAKCAGSAIPTETALWLTSIDDILHGRIAKTGLCEPRNVKLAEHPLQRLGALLDHFMDTEASDLGESTRENLNLTRENLIGYFGADRDITTIKKDEARAWRRQLAAKGNRRVKKGETKAMADNTVRRRTGRARQFFNFAIEQEIITANPFVQKGKMPASTIRNDERMVFVTHEAIEQCQAAMHQVFLPNASTKRPHSNAVDFRTMIALARYAGIRCPSELVKLKWEHVQFGVVDPDNPREMLGGSNGWGWMTIHSKKTQQYEGGAIRRVPIFAHLQWYLREAKQYASVDAVYVIQNPAYRQLRANNRTSFLKAIAKVGLTPWDKLFQNLRSSWESELLAKHPLGDVAPWLGHSVEVAAKHYVQSQHHRRVEASESYKMPEVHRAIHSQATYHQANQQNAEDSGTERQEGRGTGVFLINPSVLPTEQLPETNALRKLSRYAELRNLLAIWHYSKSDFYGQAW